MRIRHGIFMIARRATRAFLRWTNGACIEQSPAGGGAWHTCVLWKGHRVKHRSMTDALWSHSGRRIPPRVSYAHDLPRHSRGLRRNGSERH